jgi:glycyl-tRNA synthetase beta chain
MKTKDLLLEIGVEEIPSAYTEKALEDLTQKFGSALFTSRLSLKLDSYRELSTSYATPRRLFLHLKNLPEKQYEKTEEIFGPPVTIAKDATGEWTKAAEGFANKNNIKLENLTIKKDEKGVKKVFAQVVLPQKDIKEIIPEIITEIISKFSFPKSMRWLQGSGFRFARPIRWIVCLLDKEIINFNIEGIKSSNITFGHRFLSKNKEIKILSSDVNTYKKLMKKNGVIVDHKERKEFIKTSIIKTAKKVSKNIDENMIVDEVLLNEVTFLTENPKVILGSFNQKYLELPADLLETSMKHHQRYFPIIEKNSKLQPAFISVTNGAGDEKIIKIGNERVLTARLSDAEFFWKEDTKQKFEDKLDLLKTMLYQKDIGSYYDKTISTLNIGKKLSKLINLNKNKVSYLEKAILMSKIDLVTNMVYEFPELQGKMGGIYLKVNKEPDVIGFAVYDQYNPVAGDDKYNLFPEKDIIIADLLKITDRLDTLISAFKIGAKVTGSSDPYGLRRAVRSVISIIYTNKLDFNLKEFFNDLEKETSLKLENLFKEQIKSLLIHFDERYQVDEVKYDIVDAVLSVSDKTININNIISKANAIKQVGKTQGTSFDNTLLLFARVLNILNQAKAKQIDFSFFDEKLLTDSCEKKLYNKFKAIEQKTNDYIIKREYKKALEELSNLKDYINDFFDKILIMDKDEKIRSTRLYLLNSISKLFLSIADFSKITAG